MSAKDSVVVIANAAAGSAADEEVDQALKALGEQADTDVVVPDGDDEMEQALRDAEGRDVVVMGGDGSLNWVLATCWRLDLFGSIGSIGLIPMGTGNDFARGSGLPLDIDEAARVAVHGQRIECDVLTGDDGNLVMNAVHAGIAAAATAHADGAKDALGAAGYAVGAMAAGAKTTGWDVVVRVDGEEVLDDTQDALMVTIAVGGSIGGGTNVAPDANHSDRKADVMIATALGAWDKASFAADLRRGEHIQRDDVMVVQGTEITIESADPDKDFLVNADGDLGQRYRQRTWT
ncbi:MAG: diacylglycerol kinase family protein, partial [Ornithinimicrobium sp.]